MQYNFFCSKLEFYFDLLCIAMLLLAVSHSTHLTISRFLLFIGCKYIDTFISISIGKLCFCRHTVQKQFIKIWFSPQIKCHIFIIKMLDIFLLYHNDHRLLVYDRFGIKKKVKLQSPTSLSIWGLFLGVIPWCYSF